MFVFTLVQTPFITFKAKQRAVRTDCPFGLVEQLYDDEPHRSTPVAIGHVCAGHPKGNANYRRKHGFESLSLRQSKGQSKGAMSLAEKPFFVRSYGADLIRSKQIINADRVFKKSVGIRSILFNKLELVFYFFLFFLLSLCIM